MPPSGHSQASCGQSNHRGQGGIPREDGPRGLGVAEPPARRAGALGGASQGKVWSRVCGTCGSVGWAGQVRTVGYDQGSRQLPGQVEDVCVQVFSLARCARHDMEGVSGEVRLHVEKTSLHLPLCLPSKPITPI